MLAYEIVSRFPLIYEFSFFFNHFPTLQKRFHAVKPYLIEGRTLEIGCGTGKASTTLELDDDEVFHLDMNPNYLRLANKRLNNVIRGDGCCLPFKTSCFEQVLLMDVFHHIYDHENLFKQVNRVLGEGGRFIIFDPVFLHSAVNDWVNDPGDGPIWKHTVAFFREKINSLCKGRFKEIAFEEQRKPSLMNHFFGLEDAVCVLEKI